MGTRVGMGNGWVGGGYTGYPPTLLEEGPYDSEAGPEGPQGLEWWSYGAGRPGPAPTLPLQGRARSLRSLVLLGPSSSKCRLLANNGEN